VSCQTRRSIIPSIPHRAILKPDISDAVLSYLRSKYLGSSPELARKDSQTCLMYQINFNCIVHQDSQIEQTSAPASSRYASVSAKSDVYVPLDNRMCLRALDMGRGGTVETHLPLSWRVIEHQVAAPTFFHLYIPRDATKIYATYGPDPLVYFSNMISR